MAAKTSIATGPINDAQLSIFQAGSFQAMDPVDRVQMVCVWARKNRNTFRQLIAMCAKEAANPSRYIYREDGSLDHIVPLRRGDLYMTAQLQGLSISLASEFRFDNNMWSVLSRVIIMQDPKTSRIINPNTCNIDTVDIAGEWRRHVNPNDRFHAKTWKEAKRNYERSMDEHRADR